MLFNYLDGTSISYKKLLAECIPESLQYYESRRKQRAIEQALAVHKDENGEIYVIHIGWNKSALDTEILSKKDFKLTTDDEFYDYTKAKEDEETWFVNFADVFLCDGFGSYKFKQAQIQTLEMPLLVLFNSYMIGQGFNLFLFDDDLDPTPLLIKNVPYWISVNTKPVLKDGTTSDIYGKKFKSADKEAIKAGIKSFTGNVKCNILSIAAPSTEDSEKYSLDKVFYVLKTLLCSFSAIREQFKGKVVIHSGNWGCEESTANQMLIYMAHMYAASICGIDELVLHTVGKLDKLALFKAERLVKTMALKMNFYHAAAFLYSYGYERGINICKENFSAK